MKKILTIGLISIITIGTTVSCGAKESVKNDTETFQNTDITSEQQSKPETTKTTDLKSMRSKEDEKAFQKLLTDIENLTEESLKNSITDIYVAENENYINILITPYRGFKEQAKENPEIYKQLVNEYKESTKTLKELIKMRGFKHDCMWIVADDQIDGTFIVSVVNGKVSLDNLNIIESET